MISQHWSRWGLVPSCIKTIPELMLNQIFFAMVPISHNALWIFERTLPHLFSNSQCQVTRVHATNLSSVIHSKFTFRSYINPVCHQQWLTMFGGHQSWSVVHQIIFVIFDSTTHIYVKSVRNPDFLPLACGIKCCHSTKNMMWKHGNVSG